MTGFLIIQFAVWVVLLVGLGVYDDDNRNTWEHTLSRFEIICFKPFHNFFNRLQLKRSWVLFFAGIAYTLTLPFSLWMKVNMLPFSFINWIVTGKFIHGKLAFIFKDTPKEEKEQL